MFLCVCELDAGISLVANEGKQQRTAQVLNEESTGGK